MDDSPSKATAGLTPVELVAAAHVWPANGEHRSRCAMWTHPQTLLPVPTRAASPADALGHRKVRFSGPLAAELGSGPALTTRPQTAACWPPCPLAMQGVHQQGPAQDVLESLGELSTHPQTLQLGRLGRAVLQLTVTRPPVCWGCFQSFYWRSLVVGAHGRLPLKGDCWTHTFQSSRLLLLAHGLQRVSMEVAVRCGLTLELSCLC